MSEHELTTEERDEYLHLLDRCDRLYALFKEPFTEIFMKDLGKAIFMPRSHPSLKRLDRLRKQTIKTAEEYQQRVQKTFALTMNEISHREWIDEE